MNSPERSVRCPGEALGRRDGEMPADSEAPDVGAKLAEKFRLSRDVLPQKLRKQFLEGVAAWRNAAADEDERADEGSDGKARFDIGEIVREFGDKYGLPRGWVLDGIQRACEDVLRERFNQPALVILDEHTFEAYLIGTREGCLEQRRVPTEKLRGWNTLRRRIQTRLLKDAVFRDFENLRPYEGTLVQGRIVLVDPRDGTLYVHAEIRFGEPIVCVCEKRAQPSKERLEGYVRGEERMFRVTKVRTVMLNDVPRLKVHLDRTSPMLPVLLIQRFLEQRGLWHEGRRMKPVRRIVGAFCLIATPEKVPADAIRAAADDLGERIRVVWGKQARRYLGRTGADERDDPCRDEDRAMPGDTTPTHWLSTL